MVSYKDDREFTNNVHKLLAIPKIYNLLWWQEVDINPKELEYIDINHWIDYVFKKDDEIKTIQERFRYSEYSTYTDFTIRYRRDNNFNNDRHESEYYKMKADYFVYWIINQSKNIKDFQATEFIKYAIVDLKKVYEKINNWLIEIRPTLNWYKCIIENWKIICPVNQNKDWSSSFFPIDIKMILYLWKNENIVLFQKWII